MAGPDDVDIGISIHETPGSQAVVDALRAKLVAYRQTLQDLVETEVNFGSGEGTEKHFLAIDAFVEDATKNFIALGETIKGSSTDAAQAFRDETRSLQAYVDTLNTARAPVLALDNALAGLALRQNFAAASAAAAASAPPPAGAAGSAALGPNLASATSADVNREIGAYIELGKQIDLTSEAAVADFRAIGEAIAQDLIDLGATRKEIDLIGAASDRAERAFGASTTAPSALLALGETAARLPGEINSSIGAFQELGKQIDVTSTAAVASYRDQGRALAENLLTLGATEEELRKVAGSVTAVERRQGAVGAQPGPQQTVLTAEQFEAVNASAARLNSEINTAIGAYAELGKQVDVTNAQAVSDFRDQGTELQKNLLTLGATDAELKKVATTIAATERRQGAQTVAAPVIPPDQLAAINAQASRFNFEINSAIGEYVALGKTIDLTSKQAVADYRAQGVALQQNLLGLQATESELGRVAAAAATVETAYGANTAALRSNTSEVDKVPVTARRGANAVATLAFGLESGAGSARSMAIGLGSAISAMAAFAESEQIAAAATGIGALITVLAVVVGLFYELNKEGPKAEATLGGFSNLNAKQLKSLDTTNKAYTEAAAKRAAALADQVDEESKSASIIDRIHAAYDTFGARKAEAHYKELLDLRTKLTEALVAQETQEAKEVANAARTGQEKANELTADRVSGPAAAARLAADNERKEALLALSKQTGAESDLNAAREAIQRTYTEKVFAINRDRNAKVADLDRQFSDQVLASEAQLAQGQYAIQAAAVNRKFELDKQKLDNDRDLNPRELVRLTNEAEKARDSALAAIERNRNQHVLELYKSLNEQILTSDAKLANDQYEVQRQAIEKRFQAQKDANTKDRDLTPDELVRATTLAETARTEALLNIEKDRTNEINKIRNEAAGRLDQASGQGVNAAKIADQFTSQLRVLHAAIDSASVTGADKKVAQQGIDFINALIPVEVAKARLDEINKNVARTLASENEQLTQTQALLADHDITGEEARQRTIVSLTKQRDAVAQSIPILEEQAALLPGDADAQAKVDAYTTKLLQLNIAISHASDAFHDLKESGIDALEKSVVDLITKAPGQVLNQTAAMNNISAIQAHLASAQAELADLLKGPQNEASAQRITQLRSEIQGVNIDLGNAKDQLVTWKSVFLDAARSIVAALFEVEARMFAVYLVQQALSAFGGGGGGGVGGAVKTAGEVASVVLAASGGLIRGPGTGVSDSIPARLSDGEFVVNAAATRKIGADFLHAINNLGDIPHASMPSRIRGYASGGLVTADGGSATGASHSLTLGLEDGVVLRHLESTEGETTILKIMSRNKNKLKSILG